MQWYLVYDLSEALWEGLDGEDKLIFQSDLNEYLVENGIGWKMDFGLVEFRGDETFETRLRTVESALEKAKVSTAQNEIKEAIHAFLGALNLRSQAQFNMAWPRWNVCAG